MPKQVDLRVTVGGYRKENLRVGDYLDGHGIVDKIEEKTKWAFVVTSKPGAIARRIKLPLGSEVNITREEATEEEVIEDALDHFLVSTLRSIEQARSTVNRQMLKVSNKAQERNAQRWYDAIDIDEAVSAIVLQEEARWWAIVKDIADYQESDKGADPRIAYLRGVVSAIDDAKRLLMNPHSNRVLSRSTSVTSNLTEDLRRESAAKFIEEFRWSDLEVIQHLAEVDGEES